MRNKVNIPFLKFSLSISFDRISNYGKTRVFSGMKMGSFPPGNGCYLGKINKPGARQKVDKGE